MKASACILSLFVLSLSHAADLPLARQFDATLQSRIGFDSNPTGMRDTIAAVPGDADTFSFALGVNVGISLPARTPALPSLKLSYAGEVVRFDGCPSENYSTHRLGLSGQRTIGAWKTSGDASSIFIDGSDDTLLSSAPLNANAIPLWRERRHQWQHRLKLLTQVDRETYFLRAAGTLLDYNYQTRVAAGKIAFADRSDAQTSYDLGWKQSANSLWLAGVRLGRQNQAIVPLPNCAFDYSNDYVRLAAGWEGKPFANTTVTFAAGPDFRHYTGAIDPRVFLGGRARTSLWFEGNFATKLSPTVTLTGRAARMDWLSSTGKSAYIDTGVETALAWNLVPTWTLRLSAKVHRCDYFPARRDDWESLLGVGATLKLSQNTVLTVDLLRHQAWNTMATLTGREFRRLAINIGVSSKL